MARAAEQLEAVCQPALSRLGSDFRMATAALLALCALAYLPGFLAMPPVDRTEVVFAQTSRDMLGDGRLIDPRYLGQREQHRPIGTFWAQMASAKVASIVAGPQVTARMQPYRMPSLVSVTLAVLLTYWLLAPLLGGRTALVGAGLFAVSPIAGLHSLLAVAEPATLAPAVAAQLALMRIHAAGHAAGHTAGHTAGDNAPTRRLALLFWAAQGVAITLNALAVPILCLATLIALYAMERRLAWLHRLHAAWGVPVLLLLGAPWLGALVATDGGMPFAGLTFDELLRVLGGSQAMKFKAWPLTFTLGLLAGLLPCAWLLRRAGLDLWQLRLNDAPRRFLLAWLLGYLAYLEFVSSKPALYTVQIMLPAATIAVALVLARDGADRPLRLPDGMPAWPAAAFAITIPVLYLLADRLAGGERPMLAALLGLMSAIPLGVAALAARREATACWLLATLAGFALFLAATLGGLMPRMEKGWTTEAIAAAVGPLRACHPGAIAVVGYREPSTVFTFGASNVHLDAAGWTPAAGLAVVDDRQAAALSARAAAAGLTATPRACLETINVTRGCTVRFTAMAVRASGAGATSSAACTTAARFACGTLPANPRFKLCQ